MCNDHGTGTLFSSAIWSNARQPGAGAFPLPEVMVRRVNNAAEDLRSPLYERRVMRQHALTLRLGGGIPVEQVAGAAGIYL
jgi:hypothetical protein